MIYDKLNEIINNIKDAVKEAKVSSALNDIKVKYLGKSGELSGFLRHLKDVPNEEKPMFGKRVNEAKNQAEEIITLAEKAILEKENEERIKRETLDVTLSKKFGEHGGLNPLSIIKNDIIDIFSGLGFQVADGPEIDFEHFVFSALNIPKDHPSRDSSDTFYITDDLLLRTQTSAVQVHVMQNTKPPIRIICPGKVYRPDDDATHSPMFQQIEGLVVDEHITLCDLMGVLQEFAKSFFSAQTKIRFRPSHFPFTEPSVEVDLSCAMCGGAGCRLCKGTGWLELLGAGVVNPVVLDSCGIDSKKYSGLAFGMGVERAAMVKYGIPDMRLLFDNDIRILKQFR